MATVHSDTVLDFGAHAHQEHLRRKPRTTFSKFPLSALEASQIAQLHARLYMLLKKAQRFHGVERVYKAGAFPAGKVCC